MATLLPGLSRFFASGLSSPGLLGCLALCLGMLTCCTCGCAPTVCWPRGFVGFCLSFAPQLGLVLQVPVGSLLTYGSHPSRWGHPCGVEASFVLVRNEGLVCFPFPFGLFFPVVPTLRDVVTLWVRCWFGSPAAGRGCCTLSPYGWASTL